MNRPPILLLGFTKYTDQGLVVKQNFIVECMTLNALYPDSGTKLTDVSEAAAEFLIALGQKGKVLNYKEIKAAARKALITALKVLGVYVRDKYPGDVTNWLTSGYDVQTFDSSTQVPETPDNLKPSDGPMNGDVIISYNKMKFAYYYEGRCRVQGEVGHSREINAGSRTKKMLFEALEPGKVYEFEVRSRGTKGLSRWSAPVRWMVR